MNRIIVFVYGAFAYVAFLAVFVYLAAFLLGLFLPKTIDGPVANEQVGLATIAINVAAIAQFGVLHSLLARDWVKAYIYKILPVAAERSTYVLQSSISLALAMWLWQPMPGVLWHADGFTALLCFAAFGLGTGIVLWSTFLIDHFELFGLRQIWTHLVGNDMPKPEFKTPVLYQIVRHPMQLGIVILMFATPVMTWGHLLFAGAMTGYIFVGLYFEERALLRMFGARYEAYKASVPMLFPRLIRRSYAQRAG